VTSSSRFTRATVSDDVPVRSATSLCVWPARSKTWISWRFSRGSISPACTCLRVISPDSIMCRLPSGRPQTFRNGRPQIFRSHQANKELSLPAQRRQIGGYIQARGMTVEREFYEPGASAKSMNRPAFRQMLEYVLRPGSKVGVIVVAHASRFTRNSTEARIVKSKLRKFGVRVVSVCQDLPDDPMGELMECMYECFDQYESRINGARTSSAMADCARQNFYPSAHAPYGYRRQPVELRPNVVRYRLVPDPAEPRSFERSSASMSRMAAR
jgi:DNA invertase Pin-like site-specific DNA recombinase